MSRRRPREQGTSLRARGESPRLAGTNPRARGANRRLRDRYGERAPAVHDARQYRRALARWKVAHGYASLCPPCDDTGWLATDAGYVRCPEHVTLTGEQVAHYLRPRM